MARVLCRADRRPDRGLRPASNIQFEASARTDSFWTAARHEPLSPKEVGIYTMIDSVKQGIRAENQPGSANSLARFPTATDGSPISYALGREPYMEASLGIGNIFKILRLDFVKRLSYLDHPGAPTGIGLRFRVKVEF